MVLKTRQQSSIQAVFEPDAACEGLVRKRIVVITNEPHDSTHEIPVEVRFPPVESVAAAIP